MNKITNTLELRARIAELELQQTEEARMLKEQFREVYESLKPVNLIKASIKEVAQSDDLQKDLFKAGVGMATGYVSKMLLEGNSKNPLRKLLGTVVEVGVTNVVSRNTGTIAAVGKGLLGLLMQRRKK